MSPDAWPCHTFAGQELELGTVMDAYDQTSIRAEIELPAAVEP
jgi:hypothetical protein